VVEQNISPNGSAPQVEHFDVLVIGAGLSGIGAGVHLQRECPDKTYAILEARGAIGGTWDLFRYPGIRSDSDMYTLGYSFKPWSSDKSIADGASILEYVREAAEENGVDQHIRFHHRVVRADWSTPEQRWHVEAERTDTGETVQLSAGFMFSCSGYYRYDRGYTPDFEGTDRFNGRIVHPQLWPEDLDYEGKRVVVIGSGATAVTLVPAMAARAAHVTMLQRSPTYIVSLPGEDPIAKFLRKRLPAKLAYSIVRWKNVLLTMLSFQLSRRRPRFMKAVLRKGVERRLPPGFDVDTHFKPRYNPWQQRLCLVPDGDLFEAIGRGQVSIVTDTIDRFTETGIRLGSGQELEADVVVTATGLQLLPVGGVDIRVDGEPVDLSSSLSYRGMMLSDVPNAASAFGYTNASWTLKCDLTCEYVCRLLNYMDAHGYTQAVPRLTDPTVAPEPFVDFNSGYVLRAIADFPKQGSKRPWRLYQNYARDIFLIRRAPLDDGVLEFSRRSDAAARAEQPAIAAAA
jgi:cation diffusion facilitator CzcD-associated flavoprotein CzcO